MTGLGNLAMARGEDLWFRLEGWLRAPPRNSVWAPASHFCPAPRATEYQGGMGTSEGGQNGLAPANVERLHFHDSRPLNN